MIGRTQLANVTHDDEYTTSAFFERHLEIIAELDRDIAELQGRRRREKALLKEIGIRRARRLQSARKRKRP